MTRSGGAIRTGGKMSAGKLTGAMLRKTLKNHLHPQFDADIQGAGLFDKLASVINMGNIKRLYGAIDKGISIGTKGYSAFKDIKKGIDGMKKKDDKAMIMPSVGMTAGAGTATGGAIKKSRRKLPEALRKRAEFLGEMMKKGKSMKEASEMYKAQK